MIDHTIRPVMLADLQRIKEIAVAAKMFTADETEFFDDMVAGFVDGSLHGHHWLVVEEASGAIVAAAQFAPEPFADRMWNLYFIAVEPGRQGEGIGTLVMEHVESELRQRGESEARTLVVETSSTDQYARARTFYSGLGYDQEARIREFYGPGDHKIVFWKSLV